MDRLAELRERRALTLRELAEMSGVAADTINQIELGHRKPRPSTLRKLARALEVDIEEFYAEPALVGKAEAPQTGPPRVTREQAAVRGLEAPPEVEAWQLSEHGIPATDAEVRVLNMYLEGFWRAQETGGPFVTASLAKDNVNHERIALLATFVLTEPGLLTLDEAEAVRQGVHAQLVGAGR